MSECDQNITGWQRVSEAGVAKLTRRYQFANFAEAYAFVERVSALAEAANHHPDIRFGWGYVELVLFSHDVGGLTARDAELAEQINALKR